MPKMCKRQCFDCELREAITAKKFCHAELVEALSFDKLRMTRFFSCQIILHLTFRSVTIALRLLRKKFDENYFMQ